MGLSAVPSFAQRWHRATRAAGDRPFLVWEGSDGAVRQWSYAEFGELADDVAGYLASRGVQRGDAVHVALSNSPAFVAVWLAVTVLGATLVPSDPEASARELADCMRRTRAVAGVGRGTGRLVRGQAEPRQAAAGYPVRAGTAADLGRQDPQVPARRGPAAGLSRHSPRCAARDG
jgi:crotonobetaine/carnitine-CoA ligase